MRRKVVYVLKCQQEKYYAGECDEGTVNLYYDLHQRGRNGEFTARYAPVDIELFTVWNLKDILFAYAARYGIDNVRGDQFNQQEFLNAQNDNVIYVLKCESEKYYVGKCLKARLYWRFEEHCIGEGAVFTQIYPPFSIYQRFTLP
jgi:predicted GIY-YIG superfamily endonuclease